MNKHAPFIETDDVDDLHIRIATVDDMDECMKLALSATDENALLPPNPAKLAAEMWAALNLDNGIVGVIGKPNGIIEGIILIRMGTMWYSDQLLLEEKAIYIHDDFRSAKGARAKRLANFAKMASDTLNIPLLIGVLSSERTAGKVRMYRREFGEPAGAFFIYHGKTGLRAEDAA